MAAAPSSFCPNRALSLPTAANNHKTSLQPLLRFPASASSIPSRSRLCFNFSNRNFAVKASAAPAAPVMDQSTSSSPSVPTIVEVDLGNRSYPIYIGSGLLNQPELLQR